MNKPLKVFISYAHKDTESKDKLINALDVLRSEDIIETWHDNDLQPGDRWRDAISNNLADSDILLYLVSADSLAFENRNKELTDALHNKDIRVVPVILEPCDWLNHELSNFQALPDQGKPINEWEPESRGWQNVVEGVREVVANIRSQSDPASDTPQDELRAESALQRANFLAMIGQQDAAIEAYSELIELYPRFGAAYSSRGGAYAKKGDLDAAIQDCSKAIEIDPSHANAYSNRGNAYAGIGHLDAAIRDFDKAIELDPNNADAYNNRGGAYFIKDELDNALADFTSAIAIKPDFVLAYDNRAKVWFLRQELEKAVLDLASALARSSV